MSAVKAGCGKAEITPTKPCALSGFIARRNQPFTRVDDDLFARVLALEEGGKVFFLLNYDLLGFDAAVRDGLIDALEKASLPGFSRERCMVTTTHTHSGPAVSPIEGETGVGEEYLALLRRRTVEAARQAVENSRPAVLRYAQQPIEGLTYNRRAVLADGRVSIAYEPNMEVVERGPLDNLLTLLVWKDEADPARTLAALAHFPCHGVALLTPAVSGDIPGQVVRQMEAKFGTPCLFLQGPAGDVNPIVVAGERSGLLEWSRAFAAQVEGIENRLSPAQGEPVQAVPSTLPIAFRPLPEREEVERNIRVLEQVAGGDFSSFQTAGTVGAVANLLNIRPGDAPDPVQTAFTAHALARAERRVLKAIELARPIDPCPLEVGAWRIGEVILVFMGAEIFSTTGLHLRKLGECVLPVAYAAPIVGYIPDAESMRKGGYEANDAWRFYGQPGPFELGAEEKILDRARELIGRVM